MTESNYLLLPKEAAKALHETGNFRETDAGPEGYATYRQHQNGLSFDGKKLPYYSEMRPDIRAAWDHVGAFLYELGRLAGHKAGYSEGYSDGEEDGKDDCCPPESARMSDRTLG